MGNGKLTKVVHWQQGKWAVVSGPFPDAMYRSETRDTVAKAAKLPTGDCINRPGTTREDQYAKVLLDDLLGLPAKENEFGPVMP